MQVNYNQIENTEGIRLLLKDLFARNKDLRYEYIVNQIIDKILTKWLEYAHDNRLYNKPMKCSVRFVYAENGIPQPETAFNLMATLEYSHAENVMEYCDALKKALTFMRVELRDKYDLDKLEFDGEDAIKVYEFHDIMKGF